MTFGRIVLPAIGAAAVVGGGVVCSYVPWEAGVIRAEIKEIRDVGKETNGKLDHLTGLIEGALGMNGEKI